MERGRAGNTSGESRENAAVVCARLHLSGIGALASHGLEQLRLAEIHLLTLATEPSNTEALEAVARVFCNLRKAARRLKLRDLHYYVADQERLLRDGLDACFFSERSLDAILNTIGVLKKYLAYMKEVLAGSDTLPSPKLLPALRRSAQSSVTPQRATPSVSPQDPRKRLGEMLMASGDISAGDLQEALFQCEGFNGHKRLGELLLEEVRLSREQLERAIQEQQQKSSERPLLGQILVDRDVLSKASLNKVLEKQKRPMRRRLGETLVQTGRVPAKRIAAALRGQSVVRDAVRYGLASPAARFAARATEAGHSQQRNRISRDKAADLTQFCAKARELLAVADRNFLVLESEPENGLALDSARRAIRAVSRFGCYLDLADIGRFGRAFSGYLAAAANGRFPLTGPRLDVALDCVEVLRRHLGYIEEALKKEGRICREKRLPDYIALLHALSGGNCEGLRIGILHRYDDDQRLGNLLVSSGCVARETLETALAAQAEAPESPKLGEVLAAAARISHDQADAAFTAQQENPSLGRLGNILVQWGLVERQDIETALSEQRRRGRPPIGEILMRTGAVPAKAIAQALRRQRLGRAGAAAAFVAASILAPAIPAGASRTEPVGDAGIVWVKEKGQTLDTAKDELRDAMKASLASNPALPETDSDGMLDGWEMWTVFNRPGILETDKYKSPAEEAQYWDTVEIECGTAVAGPIPWDSRRAAGGTHIDSAFTLSDIQCVINAALDLDTPVPVNIDAGVALPGLDIQELIKKALSVQSE